MTMVNTKERYGMVSIALHWGMVLLLVAVFACIELRVLYAKGTEMRELLKQWHFMLGQCVLGLVALRLVLNLVQVTPEIVPSPNKLQKLAAQGMHLALFAFMIGLPLTGWLLLSAGGKPIPFFGLDLPSLIEASKPTAKALKEFHEYAGRAGYFLIGAHAVAALVHHHLLRDNTLLRMWPARNIK